MLVLSYFLQYFKQSRYVSDIRVSLSCLVLGCDSRGDFVGLHYMHIYIYILFIVEASGAILCLVLIVVGKSWCDAYVDEVEAQKLSLEHLH